MKRKNAYTAFKILIAMLVGVAVLCLLGLFIYADDIDASLRASVKAKNTNIDSLSKFSESQIDAILYPELADSVKNYFAQLAAADKEKAKLTTSLESLFAQREQAYQDYKCVCEGTCGSGETGRGSDCARKEQQYLSSDQRYREHKSLLDSLETNMGLSMKKEKLNTAVQAYLVGKATGSLGLRLKALWRLYF